MFFYDCTDSIFQYCESYDNKTAGGDGGGFDLDGGCVNCIVQYCYSHGNMGPGYLMYQYPGAANWSNNTFRYNISENDGTNYAANPLAAGIAYMSNSGALTGVKIYNNTVYQNLNPAAACIAFAGNQSTSGVIVNNIFYTGSNSPNLLYSPLSFSNLVFTGNDWFNAGSFKITWNGTTYNTFTAWRTASGQETISGVNVGMTANPMLAAPGSGGTVNSTATLWMNSVTAYKQTVSSPVRNAGRNLLIEFGISNGGQDFYAAVAPFEGSYDIGAHEGGH
jgi:hypothetical protein